MEPDATKEESKAVAEKEKLLKKTTKLKNQIEIDTGEFETAIDEAQLEIEAKNKEISTNVEVANKSVSSMKESAISSIEDIQNSAKKATESLENGYNIFNLAVEIVPVSAFIIYYVVYAIFYGFVYNVAIFGGLAIAGISYLILKSVLDRIYLKLVNSDSEMTENLKTTRQKLGSFLSTRVSVEPNLKRIDNRFVQAVRYGKTAMSSIRDYIPSLETYYDNRERITRQMSFINTLNNALIAYGFKLRGEANEYLLSFGPLTNSEDEWLEESTETLAQFLDVSKMLLCLAYYDYVNDTKSAKDLSKNVIASQKLTSELARILITNNVVDTEYIEKSAQSYGAIENIIRKDSIFNLDIFKNKYYLYYIDVAREKQALIEALRQYGIKLNVSTEEKIKKYVPSTFEDISKRQKELFEFAAKLTDLPTEIVELSYYEREVYLDRRYQVWAAIKKDGYLLEKLTEILINSNLIEIPLTYKKERLKLVEFMSKLLEPSDDFTISKAKTDIEKSFDQLEASKEIFIRSLLNKIVIDEVQRKDFTKWIEPNCSLDKVASRLENYTRVPKSVLLLFYYDYVQDNQNKTRQFELLKTKNRDELARILLEYGFIAISGSGSKDLQASISNLSILLMRLPNYDRGEIQYVFSNYNQLLDYSKDLTEFLTKQDIINKKVSPDFNQLLDAVNMGEKDQLSQQQLILNKFILDYSDNLFASEKYRKAIVIATLSLYSVSHNSALSSVACTNASSDELSSHILYSFSRINDEEEQKGQKVRTKLAEIINKTIDNSYKDYQYFVPFREALTSGYLYPRISNLMNVRLDQIDKQIADKNKLEKKIQEYEGSINTFLKSELEGKVIMESLRMQLINAYLITKIGQGKVMGKIVDDYLPKACIELSKENPIYKDFFLVSDYSVGSSTRIGIVPFQMNFDEFSSYFEKAYNKAVNAYAAGKENEEFSANVIRVFPSDSYFKQVGIERVNVNELPDNHPVAIIRNLVLEHYTPIENLELIASLQAKTENKIALKSLFTTFCDGNITNIYLLTNNQLNGLISGSKLFDYIKGGKFDRDLMKSFSCSTLSQLVSIIYSSSGRDGANSKSVQKKLNEEIATIAKDIGSRGQDIEAVSSVIYQVLYDIGMILNGFSA